MRVNREARPLILSVLVILLVVLGGCKAATTGGRVGPDAVYQAPEYPTLKLESLAYLGLASVAQEPTAIPVVDDLVRSYLLGGQQKFVIVDRSTVQSRAIKEGVDTQLNSLIMGWQNQHSVDRLSIQSLGQKLGFDGFIFADLARWREERVDWTSEGNSFTEVGIALLIYEAGSGLLVWKGEKMQREESLHYRHGDGAGSGVYRESGSDAIRTERAEKLAPLPPPAAEVAESAVQNLIMGLPDKPCGAAKP